MVLHHGNALDDMLDRLFGALSTRVRRELLLKLRSEPLPVAALVEGSGVSWSAITKHLKALEDAHLVVRHKEGRLHRMALSAEPLPAARAWLDALEDAPALAEAPVPLPHARALAHAGALCERLGGSLPLARAALDSGTLPAGLAAELSAGLEAFEALERRLERAPAPTLDELLVLTRLPGRLAFLLRHHPEVLCFARG